MAEKRVDSTALTTDAPTNLGIHLAVMLASLKLKDDLRAARLAYSTMKGSWMVVHLAAKMVVMSASPRLKVSQRAGY